MTDKKVKLNKKAQVALALKRQKRRARIRYWGLWALASGALFVLVSAALMWRFAEIHKNDPEEIGVSFSQVQAERYGVDWKANYLALLDDLHVKHLRIAAYWDRIEPSPGKYDFSETDWMIQAAAAHGADVKLVIGQKVIRYPECYYPSWLNQNSPNEVGAQANAMLAAVTDHYRGNSTIQAYQLENEFLLHTFGVCPKANLTTARLKTELKTVQSHDSTHAIILTQSNQNGWPVLGPSTDYFGFSMYRTVWNPVFGYFTYPQRGIYDWWKAAWIETYWPTTVTIHELQAEAWGPVGNEDLSWTEAQKSMSPAKFADNIKYARETHIKKFDLWGSEWWYWLKTKQNHPEMWQEAKKLFTTGQP